MRIGGLQKHSLVDYPGKISSILFLQGCNFRCPFCHNPGLVLPEKFSMFEEISQTEIFNFLDSRKKLIDAVVITGGEPTIFPDLPELIKKIKEKGFLIKLDTNGTNPEMLKQLLKENLLDFVAMDIKSMLTFDSYNKLVGNVLTEKMWENIQESINIIKESEIYYELRTTMVKGLHTCEELKQLIEDVNGVKRFAIQNYSHAETITNNSSYEPFAKEEINNYEALAKQKIPLVIVRD